MSNSAKFIKITSLPHGDAPDWVRNAWIGCSMPCEPECGHIPQPVQSVLPPKRLSRLLRIDRFLKHEAPQKVAGYSVDTTVALVILRKKSPSAARWFYDRGYPKDGMAFRFRAEEVTVIETVPEGQRGKVVRYDDMETGTLRPLK